jgi:hypothetical protein
MNSYVESGTNSTWWQTVRCPGLRPGGSQTEKCHISVNFGFTKKNQVAELFQIMTYIQKCTKTSNIMCTGFFLPRGAELSARTAGYLFNFPATPVPSTLLQALRNLMCGVVDLPVPGLCATSHFGNDSTATWMCHVLGPHTSGHKC